MKFYRIAAILLAVITISCSVMKKNPYKDTEWEAIEEMFVADAGTMTITHTLKFYAKDSITVGWKSHMPAHPASFMRSDGSVDVIPASDSEYAYEGTYTCDKSTITVTLKDGSVTRYQIEGDTLVFMTSYGAKLVFTRK